MRRCLILGCIVLGAFTSGSCQPSREPAAAHAEVRLTTLDQAGARLSQLASSPLRNYSTYDFGRERDSAARSVIVPRERAGDLLQRLRRELGPDLVAFIGTTQWLGDEQHDGDEIVIGTGASQFDMLRLARSDGINYDLETEDLINKLSQYDEQYGIDIYHAETDTVEFVLGRIPDDLTAFCQDLYRFCPDIVDQGTGTIDKLESEISTRGQVFLWWD
jgi:hypothetical protein